MDFVALQTGQALQFQIKNSFGLSFRKAVSSVFNLTVGFINQLNQRFNLSRRPGFAQQGVLSFLRIGRIAD